jgi:hypothetical protein
MLMKQLAREADNTFSHVQTMTGQRMNDVRMSTTDNYQGEESDIVRIIPTSQLLYHLFFIVSLSLCSLSCMSSQLPSSHRSVELSKREELSSIAIV